MTSHLLGFWRASGPRTRSLCLEQPNLNEHPSSRWNVFVEGYAGEHEGQHRKRTCHELWAALYFDDSKHCNASANKDTVLPYRAS